MEPATMSNRGTSLIAQYEQIHASKAYGRSSELKLGYVQRELLHLPQVKRVVDFGCGQSRLIDWVGTLNGAEAVRYDPAIPAHSTMPDGPFDAVICTDVMEHVDAPDIPFVLGQIKSLSPNAYFNISIRPAIEVLPNGENAHTTVQPLAWWGNAIADTFGYARRASSNDNTSVTIVTWKTSD